MPLADPHKEYAVRLPMWTRIEDLKGGSDIIKSKEEDYLPRLGTQRTQRARKKYDRYLERALLFNGLWRTLTGLIGTVFQKDISFTVPDRYRALTEPMTSDGLDIHAAARHLVDENLTYGFGGVLVDMPRDAFEDEDALPYATTYRATDIVNWRHTMYRRRKVLDQVIVYEHRDEPTESGFGTNQRLYCRVYELSLPALGEWLSATEDIPARFDPADYPLGCYRVREFKLVENERGEEELVEVPLGPIPPLRRGLPLNFIPFFPYNALEPSFKFTRPPLLDLVDVNLAHYRNSADYEHGLHFAGIPTAVAAGFGKNVVLEVGGETAWQTENEKAHAEYLEFTGQGLSELRRAMDEKVSQMAVLGARLLEQQKTAVEAAETVALKQSGEQATLYSIVYATSECMAQALRTMYWWAEGSVTHEQARAACSVQINREFTPKLMTPSQMVELVSVWMSRGISRRTMMWNFENARRLPPGVTAADEIAQIESEPAPVIDEGDEILDSFDQ